MMRNSSLPIHTLREPPANRRPTGDRGERAAEKYLLGEGMQILERGLRFRGGEIDLIGRDGLEIVFIEVKARSSDRFGAPFEAVTFLKQQRIIRAASYYLASRGIWDHACRFDVVSVRFAADGSARIEHMKDAFRADRR
ncbi:MAG TPA: YraN family protein [Candidatus Polarisedimenticolia bacterium]|jgi:putative endonuclease|nr:YraN family protein [Candidatus Polarisedimenticolia bacterium]